MADTYPGQAGLTQATSDHNVERLHRQRELDERRSMIPCVVKAVHGGGVGPAPTLDVVPLIHSVDGMGDPTPHDVIYSIPAVRNQSANGAIISDPQPGDMGLLHVADRDVSTLKNTGQASTPGSNRRGGLADGFFHGATLIPGSPKQYLFFRPDGVTLFDQYGNMVETFSDRICVVPKQGNTVYLGGDGKTGSYSPVSTVEGPCINVEGRTG